MFSAWLEATGIDEVEQIREATIRKNVLSWQTRGKYTACAVESIAMNDRQLISGFLNKKPPS